MSRTRMAAHSPVPQASPSASLTHEWRGDLLSVGCAHHLRGGAQGQGSDARIREQGRVRHLRPAEGGV